MRSRDADKQRETVWAVVAQFWADTWYDDTELDQFATRIANCGFSLRELDRIALWEVCGGFAFETLLTFATVGFAAPDFFYPEEVAQKRIAAWLARPRLLSVCNPVWLIGYFAARAFLHGSWRDLRSRVAGRLPSR